MTPVPPAPRPPRRPSRLRFVLNYRRDLLRFFHEECYRAPVIRDHVFGRRLLLVNDAAGVARVLGEHAENYVKPVVTVRTIRPFTGDGLLLAEGAQWRRQRRGLAHAFTPAAMRALLPAFNAAAERLVAQLDVEPVLRSAMFEEVAFDAVLRALFSDLDDAARARFRAVAGRYLSNGRGPGRPTLIDLLAHEPDDYAWSQGARRAFQQRWFAEVDAIIARRMGTGREADDLLGSLLAARDAETGAPLSAWEVRSQAATFLAAGFETTARLMFWTTYLLALDPGEQERVRMEAATGPDRAASPDDLARWPRLRAVLQESLRLYPTFPVFVRRALADDAVAGEKVRAGDQVFVSPWTIGRHRYFWEAPDEFRPDRFDGRPNAWASDEHFIPFSRGPRVCIGAVFALTEASVVLRALLQRFRIAAPAGRPVMPVALLSIQPSRAVAFPLTRV